MIRDAPPAGPQSQLTRIRSLVESGKASSVSGFVQHAVGVTFDAGGLIAVDQGDRRMLVLLARATEVGAQVTVPATALAQAIRRPERQARLARMIRQPGTAVVPLDRVDATSIGRLLATSGTADIADAHVVICARRVSQQVVTSDPDDLRRLDPRLEVVVV